MSCILFALLKLSKFINVYTENLCILLHVTCYVNKIILLVTISWELFPELKIPDWELVTVFTLGKLNTDQNYKSSVKGTPTLLVILFISLAPCSFHLMYLEDQFMSIYTAVSLF